MLLRYMNIKALMITIVVVTAMYTLPEIGRRIFSAPPEPQNPLVGKWVNFPVPAPNETHREHVLIFRDDGSLIDQKLSFLGRRASGRCDIECSPENHNCGVFGGHASGVCDTLKYSVTNNSVTIRQTDGRSVTAAFQIRGINGDTLILQVDGGTLIYAKAQNPLVGKWVHNNPLIDGIRVFFNDGTLADSGVSRSVIRGTSDREYNSNGKYSVAGNLLTENVGFRTGTSVFEIDGNVLVEPQGRLTGRGLSLCMSCGM